MQCNMYSALQCNMHRRITHARHRGGLRENSAAGGEAFGVDSLVASQTTRSRVLRLGRVLVIVSAPPPH